MAPALLPSSVNSVPFVPGTLFCTRNENLNRHNILRKSAKQALPSTKRVLPLATSVFLFPQFRGGFSSSHKLTLRSVSASASASGMVVEQADSSATDANPPATDAENVPNAIGTTEESPAKDAPAQKKRTRPVRKSEMPPVKNEELVVGASFTGKVKSIQPFGAFIDFGAFTDGLVHVSQLSDTFVKEVASVVSVGQEVTVRLLEANMETGRISLTMRESDDNRKSQQSQDPSSSGDKGRRPPRNGPPKSNQMKNEGRKSSKFVKGQDLEGTVKNITRSGSFISLPDGEEGFLPTAEEEDGGIGSLMGVSSMEVGKEVRVRVLRITRGQVTLTMKEEETGELDPKLMQGIVHKASNPFMLAFLQNKDISSFLDSREEEKKASSRTADELKENITQAEAEIDGTSSKEESVKADAVEEASNEISEAVEESTPNENTPSNEAPAFDVAEEKDAESDVPEIKPDPVTSEIQINIEETQTADAVEEASNETSVAVEESTPNESTPSNEAPAAFEVAEEKDAESDVPETKPDPVTSEIQINIEQTQAADNEEKLKIPNSSSSQTPESKTSEEETQTSDTEENPEIPISSSSQTLENEAKNEEENLDVAGEKLPLQESAVAETSVSETESKSVISEQTSNEEPSEVPIPQENIAEDDDSPAANTVEPEQIEAVSNNNSLDSDGQNGNPSIKETPVKAAISPALVKQLREETGAGMMDCKKALSETEGDLIKAQEYLRKKGLASADKKASRTTAEGRIGSYIHDSRIGILLEVNCETDFVSRGEIFKELVDDLAMQAAACPQVQYLSSEDVPQEIVDKEREIEMQKEDLLSKPEQIRSKIVDGRIKKRLDELALLEQPFIKNDKLVVKDLVKQMISTIGENIKVTRFVRYNLGEGLEKKSQDFAAEVAAQTSAKPTATPPKEQPPVAVEAVEKALKVAVSAALVKQLREETGAGMMDCKKALAETEGDLEKAQEYLRKKGLSSADKKSSRIAAEGRIGSYIHDARIGVLIEVNCETDFVGRSEKFKELVDDLAMQVVACPQVVYVSVDDIPESVVKGEKELEMQREDLRTKPENIREKIVEGRIAKRLGEISLLEQPFIKDDSILIKDLVKQTVAALGENIKVRRFVKFTLGETAGAAAKMEDAEA